MAVTLSDIIIKTSWIQKMFWASSEQHLLRGLDVSIDFEFMQIKVAKKLMPNGTKDMTPNVLREETNALEIV